jgi:hypothetical protein
VSLEDANAEVRVVVPEAHFTLLNATREGMPSPAFDLSSFR